MKRCKEHDRYNCYDYRCKQDNAGSVSISTNGDLNIGIGGGLTIDPSDGSLGMQIAPGISIDFDGN